VSNMESMEAAFLVEEADSTANIRRTEISNNQITGDGRWTGVSARSLAEVNLQNMTFTANTNVRHAFSASQNAKITMDQVKVTANSGGIVAVSFCS